MAVTQNAAACKPSVAKCRFLISCREWNVKLFPGSNKTRDESLTEPLAVPGEVVDLAEDALPTTENRIAVLVQTDDVEIHHLLIVAGSEIPTYEAPGEIILHGLEGNVCLKALGVFHYMRGGQLLCLAINEAFSIRARENSSVLATIMAPRKGPSVKLIGGQ